MDSPEDEPGRDGGNPARTSMGEAASELTIRAGVIPLTGPAGETWARRTGPERSTSRDVLQDHRVHVVGLVHAAEIGLVRGLGDVDGDAAGREELAGPRLVAEERHGPDVLVRDRRDRGAL